jgi:hypothetical protein
VTTQAAEKLYRVLPEDPDIAVETCLAVGAGGRCEWLGQEAILFQGTRLRRRLEADVAGDAGLLAVETLVLGRGAMGEAFTQGLVHDAWHIRRDGRLIWADALHMHGDGAGEGTLSPNCPMGWARRARWPRCFMWGTTRPGISIWRGAWRQRPMVAPPVSMACCCYAGPHLSPGAARAGDGGGLRPARGGIRAGAAPAGAVDLLKGTRCN